MKFLPIQKTIALMASVMILAVSATSLHAQDQPQILELRKYVCSNKAQHDQVSNYLEGALIPALNRMDVENIGVWEAHDKEKDGLSIWLLIPYNSFDHYSEHGPHLLADTQFHQDGAEYLFLENKKQRAYERIEVTLMYAFSGWPKVTKAHKGDKLYELRDYESFSEYKGFMKIQMFNNGEIDIFNKTGLDGIFFGGVLAGKNAPNLVYMSSYKDMEERNANWKKFLEHPDWKSLSKEEQYAQTVSKIHQTFLVAKPYSKL